MQVYRDLPGAQMTDYTAELVDIDTKVLATAPLYCLPSYGHCNCGCSQGIDEAQRPPYLFQAFLTDVAPGATLHIRRGQDEVWVRHAPSESPRIQRFKAHISKSGLLSIEWMIKSQTEQELEVWLQWSVDKGKTWQGLKTGLRGKSTELDISTLPSGMVLIRLLASDGFYTKISRAVPVKVPSHPLAAIILHPRDDTTMVAGSTLRLWGVARSSSGEPLDSVSVRWLIDGKEVAQEPDAFVTTPSQGQHRCTLIVNTNGKTVEQTHKFKTVTVPPQNTHATDK